MPTGNDPLFLTTDARGCAPSGDASSGDRRAAEALLACFARDYSPSRRAFLRAALLGGLAAATVPLLETQAGAMTMPSIEDQKRLGDQAAAQYLQKYPEIKDGRLAHFQQLGTRLINALSPADRGPWDYRFHILDTPTINAFALPGGNMFMLTGLLQRITTDDELAAVTGHEMTHVRKQHWARAAAHEAERQAQLQLALRLMHANKYGRELAALIDKLFFLRYSRAEEDEADAGGLQNMWQAGYNPQGMVDLFRMFQSLQGGGTQIKWLSDHPLMQDRIHNTQVRIAHLPRR